MHISKNVGYCERMCNIRVAALTQLALMALFSKDISPLDTADFFNFEVVREFV
jgi:hypothetical protein